MVQAEAVATIHSRRRNLGIGYLTDDETYALQN